MGGGMGAPPPKRANVTSPNGIKLGPPGRWWDDKTFVHAIGLSRDQQKKMDTIFNANKPAIIETYKTYEKQQAALAAISKDPNADKEKLFAAIDAVNEARAALQKANTQMLLEIRQQLDAEQVEKLERIP
jgi:Spy/CpxP family protein refolding chaperone